jgi:hypothetical protein
VRKKSPAALIRRAEILSPHFVQHDLHGVVQHPLELLVNRILSGGDARKSRLRSSVAAPSDRAAAWCSNGCSLLPGIGKSGQGAETILLFVFVGGFA